jgi:hypothetical protein
VNCKFTQNVEIRPLLTRCDFSNPQACHSKALAPCAGAESYSQSVRESNSEVQRRFKIDLPHSFESVTTLQLRPTNAPFWMMFSAHDCCLPAT